MGKGTVLVNTSLGRPLEADAFFAWLERGENNYGIFDLPGAEAVLDSGKTSEKAFIYHRSSGFTAEAKRRLTRKVYENMAEFLANSRERPT